MYPLFITRDLKYIVRGDSILIATIILGDLGL